MSRRQQKRKRIARITTEEALKLARQLGSVVYFISSPGSPELLKIGSTNDLPSRLRALQTGNPHKLEVLCVVPGSASEEAAIQYSWAERNTVLEWYRDDDRKILKWAMTRLQAVLDGGHERLTRVRLSEQAMFGGSVAAPKEKPVTGYDKLRRWIDLLEPGSRHKVTCGERTRSLPCTPWRSPGARSAPATMRPSDRRRNR